MFNQIGGAGIGRALVMNHLNDDIAIIRGIGGEKKRSKKKLHYEDRIMNAQLHLINKNLLFNEYTYGGDVYLQRGLKKGDQIQLSVLGPYTAEWIKINDLMGYAIKHKNWIKKPKFAKDRKQNTLKQYLTKHKNKFNMGISAHYDKKKDISLIYMPETGKVVEYNFKDDNVGYDSRVKELGRIVFILDKKSKYDSNFFGLPGNKKMKYYLYSLPKYIVDADLGKLNKVKLTKERTKDYYYDKSGPLFKKHMKSTKEFERVRNIKGWEKSLNSKLLKLKN